MGYVFACRRARKARDTNRHARLGIFCLVFAIVATGLAGCAGVALRRPAATASGAFAAATPANAPVELRRLADGIAKNLDRVEEFRVIREAALELGLRVWLFGGTAAGYAHYVKWDLLRLEGDGRYLESRFDYDFTNIYRSTQDADLVVDGSVEDAVKLENLVKAKLSYLQGSKKEWEVRLLRHDRGAKQALLNNPDFMNQHTDSNSTGMIELTDPAAGESAVRDLRDWENGQDPRFLRDVAEGKLHYYYSPLHKTTSRYLAGDNPEIFSVIRYFTKAFQYELKIRDEDLARLQKIIARFDPRASPKGWSEWARGWIENRGNGAKLIKHAVNIEYAWNVLEDAGLRAKLIAMSNPGQQGSMGWWLAREPLRSKTVGTGSGRTAKEVAAAFGVPWEDFVVAHETSDFLAYESLTRDTTGRPNVLISRKGFAGEMAAYGNGHYTRVGRIGARGTGLTVRYKVDANAREGTDFIVKDDYLVFRNRNALTVIPESLNIGPVEYFRLLLSGMQLDTSDRGVLEKLKRRISNKISRMTGAETREIADLLLFFALQKHVPDEAGSAYQSPLSAALREWLALPAATNHPEIVREIIRTDLFGRFVARDVLALERWSGYPELAEELARKGTADADMIENLLDKPYWTKNKSWTEGLIDVFVRNANADQALVTHVLTDPKWAHRPDWVRTVLARHASDRTLVFEKTLVEEAFSRAHWDPHMGEFVEAMDVFSGRNEGLFYSLAEHVFSRPVTLGHPEWIEKMFEMPPAYHSKIYEHVFSQEWAAARPDWIERALALNKSAAADEDLAGHVLGKPHWLERKDWVKTILDRARNYDDTRRRGIEYKLIMHVLSQPVWKDDPVLLSMVEHSLKGHDYGDRPNPPGTLILKYVLSQPHWAHRADLIERYMDASGGAHDLGVAMYILSKPYWDRPDWVARLLRKDREDLNLALLRDVLSQPHATKHPEWVAAFVAGAKYDYSLLAVVLSNPWWWDVPECENWLDLLLKRSRIYDSDFLKILKEPRWKHRTDWLRILAGRANWDAVTESEFRKVIAMEHWQNNPELRKLSGGANPHLSNLSGGTLRQCADYLKDWARSLYHGRKSSADPRSSAGSH